jgi:cytochrome c oxidase subunit 2
VTFVGTSKDVVHGLFIGGMDVNVMLIPGQISRVTTKFLRAGEFPFICHEYCGLAHHTMWGRVVVEPVTAERGTP